ncbi:hypothetical protein [Sulfobacillus sp. hq2]|uniref:hypothetical protein n=1 Tax=Sulfobacillus TaxID=28033 RepID=UPI000CD0F592|nr:hypothetical protein [Sulfobacillus sp. hq2]POB12301.1 hypothetical protein CO251_00090 [Sulfobacillus sp. hq2]
MTLLYYFRGCEDGRNLDHYVADVAQCGGRNIETFPGDPKEQICAIRFSVDDKAQFVQAFRQTASYAFLE